MSGAPSLRRSGDGLAALRRQQIYDALIELMADIGMPRPKTDDEPCRQAGADSLDFVELSLVMEERFNIFVAEDELGDEPTLNSLVALVDRKAGQQ